MRTNLSATLNKVAKRAVSVAWAAKLIVQVTASDGADSNIDKTTVTIAEVLCVGGSTTFLADTPRSTVDIVVGFAAADTVAALVVASVWFARWRMHGGEA